jgi:sucrose-6F-phosphate phosphohydrolase
MSILWKEKAKMDEAGCSGKRILVSDIDGTLLNEGRPTVGLGTLGSVLARAGPVRLVYATGRSFGSTRDLVTEGFLPPPDAVAALVGTEVWLPPWEKPDPGFLRAISAGWERRTVMEAASVFAELDPQPARFQSVVKASFYLSNPSRLPSFKRELNSRGVRARVIYSGGKYLDVIPEESGKRSAVEYLRDLWGVESSNVLVAGDSGNDLDMLKEPDFMSVAVGNSEDKLKKLSGEDTFHLSSLPFAAGVLEGASEFDFLPIDTSRLDSLADNTSS